MRGLAGMNMVKEVANISNLEKRNHVKKHMRGLKISGSTKTDPFNILSEQKHFYQDLYTSKNIRTDSTQTAESFLSSLDIPRLTEEQKLSCEGKITPEECAAVLENFQNNKSPGNDKIPVEFYKKFCQRHSYHISILL